MSDFKMQTSEPKTENQNQNQNQKPNSTAFRWQVLTTTTTTTTWRAITNSYKYNSITDETPAKSNAPKTSIKWLLPLSPTPLFSSSPSLSVALSAAFGTLPAAKRCCRWLNTSRKKATAKTITVAGRVEMLCSLCRIALNEYTNEWMNRANAVEKANESIRSDARAKRESLRAEHVNQSVRLRRLST